MMFKTFIAALPVLAFGAGMADAGQTIDLAGTMACVNDKWDETEPAKGHKMANYAGRCLIVPDDPKAEKFAEDCVGNYEYLPDGTWKGSGTCTQSFKSGGKIFLTWEEGSHLKDYSFNYTGGTGKYESAKGGGSYKTEEVTSTLYAGKKTGKLELP